MQSHKAIGVGGILLAVMMVSFSFFRAVKAEGAIFAIKPSISLAEEYDDNIFLTQEDKQDDFITRVSPSLTMNYKTPWWNLALDYSFLWRYYAKLQLGKYSQLADLKSNMGILRNVFYLDVTDRYENVVLNPRRPYLDTNLEVNKTDSNNLTISPYIKYPLTPVLTLSAGYRYTYLWYREAPGIKRQQHTAFASLENRFSVNLTGSINAEYTADMPEETEPDDNQTSVFIKLAYALSPQIGFDGSMGYRSISFSGGDSKDRPVYDAAVRYNFSETGKVEVRASSAFIVSPEFGFYDSRMEQVSIAYGKLFQLNGSVFHRRDEYLETDRTDKALGLAARLIYRSTARLTYNIFGSYEKDRYLPEEGQRKIFTVGGGFDYRLTPRVTAGVYYHYDRSTGDTEMDNYSDNVAGFQIRTEI